MARTLVSASPSYPPIPYGMAYFKSIREQGYLYVDKTRFVRELEHERYVFFVRPRRFGKSCWVSLLESYYDRTQKDDFEALFAGTEVGLRPTPSHSRYMVLHLNFSTFKNTLAELERNFEEYCRIELRWALRRNADLFPQAAQEDILAYGGINACLNELFKHVRASGTPLYVLIDEYDNFANTILAQDGADTYHAFTHGGGFFRSFFATLKHGAETGGVERLFITGVSPLAMDDVTSGFNIGANLSFDADFNAMMGFTRGEVGTLLERYAGLKVFDQDPDEAMALMRQWYDGYRFSKHASEDVFNTDMVLYYLKHSLPNRAGPDELIDFNVRIDYGKLRHLLVLNRSASAPSRTGETDLNGNFDLLRDIAAGGRPVSELVGSFPLAQLAARENFLTLLHCFGLLSIRGVVDGVPRLGIPNQTVRRLLYGHLRDAYRDAGVFSVDLLAFDELTRAMAREGAWRPAVEFLAAAVRRQTSVRDYIAGEKLLEGFLAAYWGASGYFVFHTEQELGMGYADMVLEPRSARYPGLSHGYVIELKYLKRDAGSATQVKDALEAAKAQLVRYLADERLATSHPAARFTGIALVFHGWELAASMAV